MRLLAFLVALVALASPAAAQSVILPQLGIQSSGTCRSLTVRDTAANTNVPLGCVGAGGAFRALGDGSGLMVTPDAGAAAGSLAKRLVTGTSPGTLAAGDDGRITGAVQAAGGDASGVNAAIAGVTGVVARSLAARALDAINVRDFGAVGDGVTNDLVAIQKAAVTRGKDVFAPAGTYLVTLPSGQGLGAIPAGTVVRGAGRDVTRIVIKSAGTAYFNALTLAASGTRFEDLTLDFQLPTGGTGALFLMSAGCGGITFERVRLLGNNKVTLATPGNATTGTTDNTPYLFNVGGDCSDVDVQASEITGWHYTILKTNTSTATNRRWSFVGNRFFNNSYGHIAPNSPSGIWDGVVITGNTFGDISMLAGSAGNSHMIGLASIWNVSIAGNRFVGATSGEAIHIEEDTRNVTIAGNTADLSSPFTGWGKFVQITDNNISGTRKTPSNISITGNVARRSDGVLDSTGIDAPFDASGQSGVQGLIADGNVLDGFATGITVPELSAGSRVTNNTVRNCTTGVATYAGSSDIRDNSFETCTTGLSAFRGGLFGRQRFANVTYPAAATQGIVGLRGWSQAFELTATGSATIVKDLGSIGRRFSGTFRVLLSAGSAVDSDTAEYAASWDGSAISQTKGWNYNGGGVASWGANPFTVQGGAPFNLRVGPFIGAVRSPVTVNVEFDGIQLF